MTQQDLAQESPEAPELENSELPADQPETPEGEAEEAAASEEVENADEDPPKKHKGGFQKRIDGLTREKYELQQRLEQQQAEVEKVRQAVLRQRMEQAGDIPMPRLEDFGYDEQQYGQAVQQWHEAKTQAQQRQQVEYYNQQQAAHQQQQKQIEVSAKVSKAAEKYPDFVARVFDPQLPALQQMGQGGQAAFEAILDSDNFADIAYRLASNPSEVYEFKDLTQVQAIRRIAKLEAQLGAKPQPATSPPPPPSTIGGKGESAKDPAKMSIDEWMAWRNGQDPKLKR